MDELEALIKKTIESGGAEAANKIAKITRSALNMDHAPVGAVQWVPVEKVKANDYNPNQVALQELKLLHVSITQDGYTQPVVTVYDPQNDEYVIVDGFHRYFTMKTAADIREKYNGLLPVVVLNKTIQERMASTVRHNRARGKHSVGGMGHLVVGLSQKGWSDSRICNDLGLEPDELLRLKHTSGIAELFKDREYGRSYEEAGGVKARKEKE
jgi:ParB-like chromosome segregation protein Spo0J